MLYYMYDYILDTIIHFSFPAALLPATRYADLDSDACLRSSSAARRNDVSCIARGSDTKQLDSKCVHRLRSSQDSNRQINYSCRCIAYIPYNEIADDGCYSITPTIIKRTEASPRVP